MQLHVVVLYFYLLFFFLSEIHIFSKSKHTCYLRNCEFSSSSSWNPVKGYFLLPKLPIIQMVWTIPQSCFATCCCNCGMPFIHQISTEKENWNALPNVVLLLLSVLPNTCPQFSIWLLQIIYVCCQVVCYWEHSPETHVWVAHGTLTHMEGLFTIGCAMFGTCGANRKVKNNRDKPVLVHWKIFYNMEERKTATESSDEVIEIWLAADQVEAMELTVLRTEQCCIIISDGREKSVDGVGRVCPFHEGEDPH